MSQLEVILPEADIDTTCRYISILQSALFSVGVKRADGTVLSHEEVVNQLNE